MRVDHEWQLVALGGDDGVLDGEKVSWQALLVPVPHPGGVRQEVGDVEGGRVRDL